jgi:hypothetical protein
VDPFSRRVRQIGEDRESSMAGDMVLLLVSGWIDLCLKK